MDADAIMDVGYMDAYGLEVLGRLVSKLVLSTEEDTLEASAAAPGRAIQDHLLSGLLLATFLSTLVLLYIFPIPD